MPYGLLVWATGNTTRPLIINLMVQHPETQNIRRGLPVDDWIRMAMVYKYLVRGFAQLHAIEKYENELETAIRPEEKAKKTRKLQKTQDIKLFHYSHQGSLCYTDSDKTIANLSFGPGNLASGSVATYAFWRSDYITNFFSARNKWLAITDWTKKTFCHRDISRE